MTQRHDINKQERNERILLDIVEQHIETAEPVSSRQLLNVYKYRLSSATIRNIMAELTDRGYLEQPHTSAGRIPTAKGYRYFVDKVRLGAQKVPKRKTRTSKRGGTAVKDKHKLYNTTQAPPDVVARAIGQYLAEMTHAMSFVGLLNINQLYKEGLRYLLDEPEFISPQNIRNLVEYADSLENRLDKLYSTIQDEISIFIGEEERALKNSPFSLMAFTQDFPGEERAIFGIIGPMRMKYEKNLELLNEVKNLFK